LAAARSGVSQFTSMIQSRVGGDTHPADPSGLAAAAGWSMDSPAGPRRPQPGADGIEMDVVVERTPSTVGIHDEALVAPLKEVIRHQTCTPPPVLAQATPKHASNTALAPIVLKSCVR
jgi:hypothetical protein